MRSLLNFITLILVILCVVFFPILIATFFASMFIVPLTWIYAQYTGQSYSYTIDQSNILYKLNIIGQWTLVIGACLLFFSLFFI